MTNSTTQDIIVLSDNDKEAVLAGLKAGLGLSHSANVINITPKALSDYLVNDEPFLKECEKAVKYSAKVLLVLSNQYLKEKKFKKWKENNEYVRAFIANINLWESYCTSKDISTFKAAEAYVITNDKHEAATICGMTIKEYNSFITTNPDVKKLISVMQSI
jgi:oligoribonuclease NrnB/cAMP/cGMP phosphodiesterase (DHH superfamily)